MSIDRQLDQLSPQVQRLLRTYVKRVGTALGTSLEGTILYGSLVRGEYLQGRSNVNILLCMTHVTGETLRGMTPVLATWKKEQVVSLILATAELEKWGAQFPLEFTELFDHRILLAGRDPFLGMRRSDAGLMEAAVREVRENLLRVRQRYIEGGASEESALILLSLSITALGPCLRGLLRTWDLATPQKTDATITAVCDRLGVDPTPLLDAWALRCSRISPGQLEIPRLFDRYLAGMEQLSDRLAVSAAVSHS